MTLDRPDLSQALRSGPFTTQHALDAGLSKKQLHDAVTAGWLRRPVRGVYLSAALPDTLANRCATVALIAPPDAFLCDHAAAWLHAGDRALVPGDHLVTPEVSCFRPATLGRLRRDEVRSGERTIDPGDVTEMYGLAVTTPLRTALDLGRLSRNNDVRLHGMDTMASLGTFTVDQLVAEVERFKGQRGVVGLRALAPLTDGGSESFGESALRLRWHAAHLPRPVTQHRVEGPHGSEFFLDLALPEIAFAREYDGEDYHSTDEQTRHDMARRTFLRRQGWDLLAYRKEQVFGRLQIAEQRLRHDFASAMDARRRRRYC